MLKAWSRSNATNKAERAESILEYMQNSDTTKLDIKPNIITYNAVLQCWATSPQRHGNSCKRALAILREMERSASSVSIAADNNELVVIPDLISYTTVIFDKIHMNSHVTKN